MRASGGFLSGLHLAALGLAASLAVTPCSAQTADGASLGRVLVDRVVATFELPQERGAPRACYITLRELAFLAELELGPEKGRSEAARVQALTAAIERRVAEELLATAVVQPTPFAQDYRRYTAQARVLTEDQQGGPEALAAAASHLGLTSLEVERVLARRGRAALYLDRMVSPMLQPSEALLRQRWRSEPALRTRFPEFETARERLARDWLGEQVRQTLRQFFQNARGRVGLAMLMPVEEVARWWRAEEQ